MMEAILICSCSGVQEKAKTSFKIIFPDREQPAIHRGRDIVKKLADKYPGTNLGRYLSAISKKSGRYAYYIKADEDYNIVESYDLFTGKRLA